MECKRQGEGICTKPSDIASSCPPSRRGRWRPSRSGGDDRHVRSDDPARHLGAPCRGPAAPRPRRRRGAQSAGAGRLGRASLRRQRNHQYRSQARHRPGRCRSLPRRRADHHQWRHHHLPDGALPLTAKRMSVFTNSFAIAEHLLHNSRNSVSFPAAPSIASRTSFCRPSAASSPAISMPSACSSAARVSARTD